MSKEKVVPAFEDQPQGFKRSLNKFHLLNHDLLIALLCVVVFLMTGMTIFLNIAVLLSGMSIVMTVRGLVGRDDGYLAAEAYGWKIK